MLMSLDLIRKSFFLVAKYVEVCEDVRLIISLFIPATLPVVPSTLLLGGHSG
jgi:hypothetical protein